MNMEPQFVENSTLHKWVKNKYRWGILPYVLIAAISFFFMQAGVVLAILYVGVRTEVVLASLHYGDTVNSRRLEFLEDKMIEKIDYKAVHQVAG